MITQKKSFNFINDLIENMKSGSYECKTANKDVARTIITSLF
jgi:hypothetical protein